MSDRIDFYEVRVGNWDDWDSVCLVKTEEDADAMIKMLKEFQPEKEFFHQHMEFVAHASIDFSEW